MQLCVPLGQKVTEGSGSLCKARGRFRNLYASPKTMIIRTIETNILLAGHAARMGEIKNEYKIYDLKI
jgi:hypothetical protein